MAKPLFDSNWVIKYKLYHIPIWALYHFLWLVITVANPAKAAGIAFASPFFLPFLFYVFFQAAAVYFNLYFLVPKYLENNKFKIYIPLLLFTVLCASLCIVSGYYLASLLFQQTVQSLFAKEACFFYFFGIAFPSTCASTTLAMSIMLARNWIQSKRRQQLLEKEKLETEINFLKNQFNPHFLFNTINSIFFLIRKNPEMASNALARFSELLRHQLYQCNDMQISLANELDYLDNYMELERLRQSHHIQVSFEINRDGVDRLTIAPFIIMPFVENAFKHVSRNADRSDWIKIQISTKGQSLHLSVANSYTNSIQTQLHSHSGIGLQNVKRRLELVYPGVYHLDIRNTGTVYQVQLQIELCMVSSGISYLQSI